MLKDNRDIITTKMLKEKGIHRQYLKKLSDEGYVYSIARGVYVSADRHITDYYAMGEQYKSGVFSHVTALYFYDMIDEPRFILDMTFPSNIRVSNVMINAHYINKEKFEIGLTTRKLWDGTSIRIYNLERTICDIIRDKNKIDSTMFKTVLKKYMEREDKKVDLLYEYAQKFKISKTLKLYIEVLE